MFKVINANQLTGVVKKYELKSLTFYLKKEMEQFKQGYTQMEVFNIDTLIKTKLQA